MEEADPQLLAAMQKIRNAEVIALQQELADLQAELVEIDKEHVKTKQRRTDWQTYIKTREGNTQYNPLLYVHPSGLYYDRDD